MRTRLAALLATAAVAQAAVAQSFTTPSFDTTATIRKDGAVDITEKIRVNFTERQRGLIREIPIRTRAAGGRVRTIAIRVLGVTQSANGSTIPAAVQESRTGDLRLRIGSPDVYLVGPVEYTINYRVTGALTPIARQDQLGPRTEFFWNMTPSQWRTPIDKATATVVFPPATSGNPALRVLAGPRGTRFGFEITPAGRKGGGDLFEVGGSFKAGRFSVTTQKTLQPGQLMTFVLALPRGLVTTPAPDIRQPGASQTRPYGGGPYDPSSSGPYDPFPRERVVNLPSSPWAGLLPLAPLIFVFGLARRRWAPREKPLVARFDPPPGVYPSLAGVVIDDRVDTRDVVAGIVSLAQKGALRMHHAGQNVKGVNLELIGLDRARDVSDFEQTLFRALAQFGPWITPDTLRGTFGHHYSTLAGLLRREVYDRGYQAQGGCDRTGLGCLLFAGVGAAGFFGCAFGGLYSLIGMGVALVVGLFAIGKMTTFTLEGIDTRWRLRGLREFITRANEKELNYMANAMPDQALFERLLPYAVAFGVVKQWTEAFGGLDIAPPDWYVADDGFGTLQTLWTVMLIDDLLHFNHSYADAFTYQEPTSGFDGGGPFSGGDSGFGGGWSNDGGWSGSDSGSSGGWDSGGGFDSGGSSGDGGGGGGGDSW